MNENRRKILEMLAMGKITADEADRLLAALEKGPTDAGPMAGPPPGPRSKPQFLRVQVEDEGTRARCA